MRPGNEDRERLERQIDGSSYRQLLLKLHEQHALLHRFRTWREGIAFMRAGTSQDPRKDEVLRPIFEAHSADEDPRWRAILLAMFWPALEAIHFEKRAWDSDPHERWQNIVWTFLQVLCRIDVSRRPERLLQKVFNDTVHRLHDEYRRAWNRTNREFTADAEEIDALAGGTEGIDFAGIELREAQEIEIARLRRHAEAGRISEADFLLLVGTRVYGKSIADYAREAGLDYQVAKKRRQRAEAAIQRSDEKGGAIFLPTCPRRGPRTPL